MSDTLFDALPEKRKPMLPVAPLSLADFVLEDDGARRVKDWRLTEVLNYGNESRIRRLIERHQHRLNSTELYARWVTSIALAPLSNIG
jgi:hypothetical protein